MTIEQLKQALDVCSEHEACERCPAREYCGDLSVVTGEALNVITAREIEIKQARKEMANDIISEIRIYAKCHKKACDERTAVVLEKLATKLQNAITQETYGCKHLDDPNWNKWMCGDCGDYYMINGCRGPKGRSTYDEK